MKVQTTIKRGIPVGSSENRKPARVVKRGGNNPPVKPKKNLPPAVEKIQTIMAGVGKIFTGRSKMVDMLGLALVSECNPLFIGVPGTAKTALVKVLADRFCDHREFFSVLLTKFTTPKEIFGPTDIAALKDSKLRLNTAGYMPASRVAVLDEIFKASSAILNSLLTIINEREFRNGDHWETTNIRMVVGMSNEFPEDPALLAAFFDRFVLKLRVGYLSDEEFKRLLNSQSQSDRAEATTKAIKEMPRIGNDDFAALRELREAVTIDKSIIGALMAIRNFLNSKGVVISDRRWVHALQVLKASAIMAGRNYVARNDLAVLSYIAWNSDKDQTALSEILDDHLAPVQKELKQVLSEIYASRQTVIEAAGGGGSNNWDSRAANEAALKARSQVAAQLVMFTDIESNAETDDEREMVTLCRDHADSIKTAIQQVGLGHETVQVLIDTVDEDPQI